MKILFLDDMESRHDAFRKWYAAPEHDVRHVYTADDAIEVLQNELQPFDVVMLDHDLALSHYKAYNEKQPLKSDNDTGMAVARFIPEGPKPKLVIIHSWNSPAAKEMYDLLWSASINVALWPFNPNRKIEFMTCASFC